MQDFIAPKMFRIQAGILISILILIFIVLVISAIYAQPFITGIVAGVMLFAIISISIILRKTRRLEIRISNLPYKIVGTDSIGDYGTLVRRKNIPTKEYISSLGFY